MKKIPVAVGLLVCDQVIVAEKTREVTPVNCFSVRRVASFPSAPFPFTVLALLADGWGDILLEVVIERLDTYEEIFRRGSIGRFKSPLEDMRCTAAMRDCSFPVPGDYQISLLAERESIAQRKIAILERGRHE